MRIGIDLDGPCYEFDKTARYMLRSYRGCTGLDDPSPGWLLPDQPWHNVKGADWDWLWIKGVKLGLFRYGHMTKDCRIGLMSLAEMGHDLIVVTQRPENAVQDTMEWVTHFFRDIPLSGFHVIGNEPKSSVACDVLIDDRPENISDAALAGRAGILFDRPWNSEALLHEPYPVVRAYGWKDVVEISGREGWR